VVAAAKQTGESRARGFREVMREAHRDMAAFGGTIEPTGLTYTNGEHEWAIGLVDDQWVWMRYAANTMRPALLPVQSKLRADYRRLLGTWSCVREVVNENASLPTKDQRAFLALLSDLPLRLDCAFIDAEKCVVLAKRRGVSIVPLDSFMRGDFEPWDAAVRSLAAVLRVGFSSVHSKLFRKPKPVPKRRPSSRARRG
jgi:hypothetical protein